MTKNVIVQGT